MMMAADPVIAAAADSRVSVVSALAIDSHANRVKLSTERGSSTVRLQRHGPLPGPVDEHDAGAL
jgi:hypothetical protein